MKRPLPTDCHICFTRHFNRCNKPTCSTCKTGSGHGPYYEAIWYKDGQRNRVYIGRTKPDNAPPNTSLIDVRRRQQWTIKEAASRVGVSAKAYRAWELGHHRPQRYALRKLCKIYGVPAFALGFDP